MLSDEPVSGDTATNTTSSESSIFERLVAKQKELEAAEAVVESIKPIVTSLKEAAEIELSSLGLKTVNLADGSRIAVTPFTEWSLKKETKAEFIRVALKDFEDIITVNSRTAGSFMKNSEPEIQERIAMYFSKFEGKKVKVTVHG
jgi:hypothetical protein